MVSENLLGMQAPSHKTASDFSPPRWRMSILARETRQIYTLDAKEGSLLPQPLGVFLLESRGDLEFTQIRDLRDSILHWHVELECYETVGLLCNIIMMYICIV